ncbi:sugar phosphate isomerase/epimerase family protein [Rudanella lutea]|uniref:sugar phosphate isomerase/epimerase family protein n=1 Tax=Rudanella lutea TaxID=451374 RepID=UPI00037A68A5|nr:TIM barrel protein [Rudanella lutea]
MPTPRRAFLKTLSGLAGAALLPGQASFGAPAVPHLSCNSYTWNTFYNRDKKVWMADPDASLTEYVASGLTDYEPSLNTPDEVAKLAPYLRRYSLLMRSIYVNSSLHEAADAPASIQKAVAIAEAAKALGTRIVVTNPNPLKWGSADNKTDAQLTEQARNLDRLGAALRDRGLTLAYHTHDPEFRAGAREFYHMMLHTNPRHVAFCLDAHWVYRGTGNSQVALFDIVKQFGSRIVELHIRQSKGGIWQETFTDGDIDYRRLTHDLKALRVRPHLVLEQCLEAQTPHTLSAVDAHRQDLRYAREVFAGLG